MFVGIRIYFVFIAEFKTSIFFKNLITIKTFNFSWDCTDCEYVQIRKKTVAIHVLGLGNSAKNFLRFSKVLLEHLIFKGSKMPIHHLVTVRRRLARSSTRPYSHVQIKFLVYPNPFQVLTSMISHHRTLLFNIFWEKVMLPLIYIKIVNLESSNWRLRSH